MLIAVLILVHSLTHTQAGSFEYTRQALIRLESRALEEIRKLGGNPQLEQIVLKLAQVYKEPEQATS